MSEVFLPNAVVKFRGQRNGRFVTTDNVDVHYYPAGNDAMIDPSSARYKWAIHFPEDLVFPGVPADQAKLIEGDELLWDRYPEQGIPISAPRENEGFFTVMTTYFMVEATDNAST